MGMMTEWTPMRSMQLSTTDREYVAGHRFMYGDIGEHVATAALLMRGTVLRPGLVLPVIRLAPVAPYGNCMALSGNSSALHHVETMNQGVWLYLQEVVPGSAQGEVVDQTVLHELLHNELMQFSLQPEARRQAVGGAVPGDQPTARVGRAHRTTALDALSGRVGGEPCHDTDPRRIPLRKGLELPARDPS